MKDVPWMSVSTRAFLIMIVQFCFGCNLGKTLFDVVAAASIHRAVVPSIAGLLEFLKVLINLFTVVVVFYLNNFYSIITKWSHGLRRHSRVGLGCRWWGDWGLDDLGCVYRECFLPLNGFLISLTQMMGPKLSAPTSISSRSDADENTDPRRYNYPTSAVTAIFVANEGNGETGLICYTIPLRL
ncbi:unnamed protein product [Timema podura]|uniref:Uncharacterized protein n=1 Tax=Timema podura TaxID=61482 RepID=A0ABN7NUM0_TIMPD|nr:unnamed protein product [Timema podura]